MNLFKRKLYESSELYATYSYSDKNMAFYQRKSDIRMPSVGITEYDGDTYHIILDKELYTACLASNSDALEELEQKLTSIGSISLNLKYILRIFFWSILLLLPLGIIFRMLIFQLPISEQKGMLSLMFGLLFIYVMGHLFRITVSSRYRSHRYSSILSHLENETFKETFKNYNFYNPEYYAPAFNPFKHNHVKNIFRVVFYTVILIAGALLMINPIFGGSYRYIEGSYENNLDYYGSFFIPGVSETNYYEYTKQDISDMNFQNLSFCSDYYCETYEDIGDVKIYNDNFDLIFDVDAVYSDATETYIESIKEEYILIALLYGGESKEIYVIYNLETKEEVIRLDPDHIIFSTVDYIRILDFTIDKDNLSRDTFYFSAEVYDIHYDGKEVVSGIVMSDGQSIGFKAIPEYNIFDIEFMNNELYYILFEDNTGYNPFLIAKSDIDNFELEVNSVTFSQITDLKNIDGIMYFKESASGTEVFKVTPSLDISSLGVGGNIHHRFSSDDGYFLFGNTYMSFKEINIDGEILSEGIICEDCSTDTIYTKKVGDNILVIQDNNAILTFEPQDTPIEHFLTFPDLDLFYSSSNLTQQSLYNIFLISSSLFIPIPYLRGLLYMNKKRNNKLFFEKLMY